MRNSLVTWISDAEALQHLREFKVSQVPLTLAYQTTRVADLYIALVGELFDAIRNENTAPSDWPRLGNAFAQFTLKRRTEEMAAAGIGLKDALLYSAASFYFGGFSASAYLTLRNNQNLPLSQYELACFELMAKPREIRSDIGLSLTNALREGNLQRIEETKANLAGEAIKALRAGPVEWIPVRLLEKLVEKFSKTNLRAVLPDGANEFWTPLVISFLDRRPPTWDFFPSQIQAIQNDLLLSNRTFSLQMPTGAGKTAICETLLYSHLRRAENSVAVMLVPLRSLAAELRYTVVRRLSDMGLRARCAYGGTVPSGDEVQGLDQIRALVATPEMLSAILSVNPEFFQRISLVICDEGHLLDAPSRGVSLELLLARMKVREAGPPRFVFVSAIVPNIEEINSWLGGTSASVVRSTYRPSLAEFATLRKAGEGPSAPIDLEMHPHEHPPISFRIHNFLAREDFRYRNPATGYFRTYGFSGVNVKAIAAARKTLPMGAAVVFTANKKGNQGAIGLAEELLSQLSNPLPLPRPIDFAQPNAIVTIGQYLELEYGEQWIGTTSVRAGAILHHGDIPQETREVFEEALRANEIHYAICTSTLAEGVNLPIRTLVLYSVQRLGAGGAREDLLTRDIKNLVGRAGRAGATTKGLVICANEQQWTLVAPVARQAAGEPVVGALRKLIQEVRRDLALRRQTATNDFLENDPNVYSLVDGIDSTLLDLAAEEIGPARLIELATAIADQTFASQETDTQSRTLLRNVFGLRAQRMNELSAAGRLPWIKETGARPRMLTLVENGLLPMRDRWDDIENVIDPGTLDLFLGWAWNLPEIAELIRQTYQLDSDDPIEPQKQSFFAAVRRWLNGSNFVEMSQDAGLSVDDMLSVHSRLISFGLQTIIEQAVALLEKLLLARNQILSLAALELPENLRFGAPDKHSCMLASWGMRHRRAYASIGRSLREVGVGTQNRNAMFQAARASLRAFASDWRAYLGDLVFENTESDIERVLGRG